MVADAQILLLERLPTTARPDWVKSSSLVISPRGLAWFRQFGLEKDVKSLGVGYDGREMTLVSAKVCMPHNQSSRYLCVVHG